MLDSSHGIAPAEPSEEFSRATGKKAFEGKKGLNLQSSLLHKDGLQLKAPLLKELTRYKRRSACGYRVKLKAMTRLNALS